MLPSELARVRISSSQLLSSIFEALTKNPLENTFLRRHAKPGQTSPLLGFTTNIKYVARVVWAEESKNVSDLKSDLVMTSYQRRPNVRLMGNPAVCSYFWCRSVSVLCPMTRCWSICALACFSWPLLLNLHPLQSQLHQLLAYLTLY